MKAVIQRVTRAAVRSGDLEAAIGPGLLVLVGLEAGDTEAHCASGGSVQLRARRLDQPLPHRAFLVHGCGEQRR